MGLALPQDEYLPTHLLQLPTKTLVPFDVRIELLIPEPLVRCRPLRSWTSLMSVPEATVHKDYLAVARQHNIRVSWEVASVHTIAKTHPMNERPNQNLRLRVAALDPTHNPASLILGKYIGHVTGRSP